MKINRKFILLCVLIFYLIEGVTPRRSSPLEKKEYKATITLKKEDQIYDLRLNGKLIDWKEFHKVLDNGKHKLDIDVNFWDIITLKLEQIPEKERLSSLNVEISQENKKTFITSEHWAIEELKECTKTIIVDRVEIHIPIIIFGVDEEEYKPRPIKGISKERYRQKKAKEQQLKSQAKSSPLKYLRK